MLNPQIFRKKKNKQPFTSIKKILVIFYEFSIPEEHRLNDSN